MKEIVSTSLGSSKRDHRVEVELLGEKFMISRTGTNGDFKKATQLLRELNGKVGVIGLGGIDIYFTDGKRAYATIAGLKLQRVVRSTPVVDGSKLKNALERETIQYMVEELNLPLAGKKALMVSAVDRYGMAEALVTAGCDVTFGDLIFGLNVPISIRSISTFRSVARALLSVVTRMPYKMLYPLGEEQDKEPEAKYEKFFGESDIIAGDYLFIKKYMPADLAGKWIIINTVTADDVQELARKGTELLATSTPELEGRSFGTNVMEAVLISIIDKPWEQIEPGEYLGMLNKLDFHPRVVKFA